MAGAFMAKRDDLHWGRYAAAGMELAVGVTLGTLSGWWLDQKLGWRPWLTLIGAFLGFVAGLMALVRVARRAFRD
jgi:F0F1-type ATP synthase assembly protein I